MDNKFIKLVLASIVVFALVRMNTESFVIRERHPKKEMIANSSYTSSINVIDLDSHMEELIRNGTTAWVVAFYKSSHGPSKKFEQKWTSLTRSIAEWDDVVAVTSVDCSGRLTSYVCEDNGVDNFPSVQYFSPGNDSYGRGKPLRTINTVESIKQGIIKYLRKDQRHGKGGTWPNISPFRGTKIMNLWKMAPNTVRYLVFLFERKTSFFGSEMILDLHKRKYLQVRIVTDYNKEFCSKYNVTVFPEILVLGKKKGIPPNPSIPKFSEVTEAIDNYMISKGLKHHKVGGS